MQNRTSVFNIYGTTEVSSWATCYSIPDYAFKEAVQQRNQLRETMGVLPLQVRERIGEESAVANHIPIGGPMLGTSLEVRDRDGSSITTGFGEIWIGKDPIVGLFGALEHKPFTGCDCSTVGAVVSLRC